MWYSDRRNVDMDSVDLEDELRQLTDDELYDRLSNEPPTSPCWGIAIDWFGETNLRMMGLMEDC